MIGRLHQALGTAALAASLWLIAGCSGTKSVPPPPDSAQPYAANLLAEGDVIQIAFPGATNLNTVAKIPMDGTVKLAFAGEFKAAGKTPQELQDDILRVYGSQLQLKEVNVTLMQSAATVYVSGAVLRPSRVPLDRPLTVMEAIMECGGFDNVRAKPGKVKIIRQEGGKQVGYDLDLRKALQGEETQPFYLKPSDVVHVPFKTFNL
jgi:polysaccharide export outer membrane protein